MKPILLQTLMRPLALCVVSLGIAQPTLAAPVYVSPATVLHACTLDEKKHFNVYDCAKPQCGGGRLYCCSEAGCRDVGPITPPPPKPPAKSAPSAATNRGAAQGAALPITPTQNSAPSAVATPPATLKQSP
jgi:hypothetical protein